MATAADSEPAALVREFVAHLNARRGPWALMHEDAVVTVNGTTPLSGRYTGLRMIRGILLDTARDAIASLEVGVEQLITSGSRVAALLAVTGVSVRGVTFNAERHCCGCVFGVREGRIDEVIFYPDTSLIEIALYGRRFVSDV